jgi:hypothetical protein
MCIAEALALGFKAMKCYVWKSIIIPEKPKTKNITLNLEAKFLLKRVTIAKV